MPMNGPAARNALASYASADPTQAVCLLMAEIEEGQNADQGKAREWLSRAVRAPADPVWIADGITADDWEPVSPVTGALDAFEWRVPLARPPAAEPSRCGRPREPPPRRCRLPPRLNTGVPLAPLKAGCPVKDPRFRAVTPAAGRFSSVGRAHHS